MEKNTSAYASTGNGWLRPAITGVVTVIALLVAVWIVSMITHVDPNAPKVLKTGESIYNPASDKIHKEDIEALNITKEAEKDIIKTNAATDIQKKTLELQERQLELQQKCTPPQRTKVVVKNYVPPPVPEVQAPQPLQDNSWQSPFNNLQDQVNKNAETESQHYTELKQDVTNIQGDVSWIRQSIEGKNKEEPCPPKDEDTFPKNK